MQTCHLKCFMQKIVAETLESVCKTLRIVFLLIDMLNCFVRKGSGQRKKSNMSSLEKKAQKEYKKNPY
jgi:hypothetical protein